MDREVTRVARIALPDGTPVWARISGTAELPDTRERPGRPGGLSYSDTGFTERVEASVESLHSLVTGVARSLAEPLRAVRPDEVSVQFGIELTAKAGKVVGLLADGEAKAGITVTLTWNSGPGVPYAPEDGARDGARDGAHDGAAEGAHAGDGTRDAVRDDTRDGVRGDTHDDVRDGVRDGVRGGAGDHARGASTGAGGYGGARGGTDGGGA